jgi:hypothetical protein
MARRLDQSPVSVCDPRRPACVTAVTDAVALGAALTAEAVVRWRSYGRTLAPGAYSPRMRGVDKNGAATVPVALDFKVQRRK